GSADKAERLVAAALRARVDPGEVDLVAGREVEDPVRRRSRGGGDRVEVEDVVAAIAGQRIGAVTAHDYIGQRAARDGVVAGAAADRSDPGQRHAGEVERVGRAAADDGARAES